MNRNHNAAPSSPDPSCPSPRVSARDDDDDRASFFEKHPLVAVGLATGGGAACWDASKRLVGFAIDKVMNKAVETTAEKGASALFGRAFKSIW